MGNVVGAAVGAVGSLGGGGGGGGQQSQGSTNSQGTQDTTSIQRPSTYSPSDAGFAAQIPIFQGAGQEAVNSIMTGDNNNQAQLGPLIQTSYGAMDSLMDSMGITRPAEGSYVSAQNAAYKSKYDLANDPKTLMDNLAGSLQPIFTQDQNPYDQIQLMKQITQGYQSPAAMASQVSDEINWQNRLNPTTQNMSPNAPFNYTASAPNPWGAESLSMPQGVAVPTVPFDGTTYPAGGFQGNFAGQGQGVNKAVNFAGAGLNTGLGQPANSGFGAVPDNYQPTPTPYGLIPGQPGTPMPGLYPNPYAPDQYQAPTQPQTEQLYQRNAQLQAAYIPQQIGEVKALNDYNTAINMAKPTDNLKQTNAANQSANVQAMLASDPNYQFQMQQGLKAIKAQAAASGYNLSPAAAQQLSTFAQGQASSAMGAYRNQLSSIMNQGLQGVQMSQASTTNAANAKATSQTNTGQQVAGATANATSNWQVGPITQQSITHNQNTSQEQNSSGPSKMSTIGGIANAAGSFLGAL